MCKKKKMGVQKITTVEPPFTVFHASNGHISKSRFHVHRFPFADLAYNEHLDNINLIIMARFFPQRPSSNRGKLTAAATVFTNKIDSAGFHSVA